MNMVSEKTIVVESGSIRFTSRHLLLAKGFGVFLSPQNAITGTRSIKRISNFFMLIYYWQMCHNRVGVAHLE